MLKKSASIVPGSEASSTGTLPPHISVARTSVVLLIRRTVRPWGYAFGSSLAAALLDGVFEHPAGVSSRCAAHTESKTSRARMVFP